MANAVVTTATETITPEVAQEYLNRNKQNRPVKTAQVNRFARDMSAGRWVFNGETIKFDADDNLRDGQHRMLAVVQSDTSQTFLVVRGLPSEVHETVDSGTRRTPGDVLALSGYPEGRTLAAAVRLAMVVDINPNVVKETRNFTNTEIKARAENDQMLCDIVTEILPTLPKALTALVPKSVLAYSYYRFAHIDPERARRFFEALGTLANLPDGSPIIALHRRLSQHGAGPRSGRYQWEVLAYMFMTWNAWVRGETRSQIKLSYAEGDRIRLVSLLR